MKRWIAYVGPVPFPEGNAGSRRMLGNALSIAATGREVVVVSGVDQDSLHSNPVAPGVRAIEVRERLPAQQPKWRHYANYPGMGRRTREWISVQDDPPEAIIIYGGYFPYLTNLAGWARRRGIPVIFDAVEWYSANRWPGFAVSPYLWSTEAAMRFLVPRVNGVLAISKALERHYCARGMRVLRVPPLIDSSAWVVNSSSETTKRPLILAYAGSPGSKDLLATIVAAVLAVDQGRHLLRLEIAGIDESEVRKIPAVAERLIAKRSKLPSCLAAHGRLAHADSMALIGGAHFSVFLRRINRVSTFGFPTKFVESFAMGTPVIANLTSDLEDHLRDGENGLVCEGADQLSLQETLRRALRMSPDAIRRLRVNARAEEEVAFDYRHYVARFDSFLTSLSDSASHAGRIS